jgi:hypothetical protein
LDSSDQELAETVLRHLLVGTSVVGMYFRHADIYFGRQGNYRDAYLRLENRWAVVPSGTNVADSEMISQDSWLELARSALELASSYVVAVRIGRQSPDLTLQFDNGKDLFVSGDHDQFESWELECGDDFSVIAVPGRGLSVTHPADFAG